MVSIVFPSSVAVSHFTSEQAQRSQVFEKLESIYIYIYRVYQGIQLLYVQGVNTVRCNLVWTHLGTTLVTKTKFHLNVWISMVITVGYYGNPRVVSEQSKSSFRVVLEQFQSSFKVVSEQSQSSLRAISELSQSTLRVVSEHSQSSLRVVSEQFQNSLIVVT